MKKRITAFALVLALLLMLVACGDASSSDQSKDISGEESAEEGFFGYQLAQEDGYGGKTITFLTTYANDNYNMQIDPYSNPDFDESKASTVISAVAERTLIVEQALDVDIREEVIVTSKRTGGGETYNAIVDDIVGGIVEYDVIMPCTRDAALLAQNGYLLDLASDVPGLDITNDWWSQRFNKDTSVDGRVFFTIGDIGYVNKDATLFVAFNKEMVSQQHLLEGTGYSSLYDMVDDMAWTQDVMFRMAKSVYVDVNNNNLCDPGDINGIAGQSGLVLWMLFSSGERIASLGEDGYPTLTVYNTRSVSVIDATQDYINDPKNGYLSANDYFNLSSVPVADVTVPEFTGGRCLFFIDAVLNLENIRSMEQDFGVLPMPLYDDTQENYSSSIGYWTSDAVCITKGYSNDEARLKMVADVLEAMGAVSKAKLVPVYYTQTLQTQISRDEDSERMLDIIFENRTIELADVYNWGSLSNMVVDMYSQPAGSFTSSYYSIKDGAEIAIQETVDNYKNLYN